MSDRNRAIDALIAERLMGVTSDAVGVEAWKVWRREPCTGEWIPNGFTTDPAASKQARDRMRGLGWSYRIWLSCGYEYAAAFLMLPSGSGEARAATEELAVALAALAALGIEAPQ